MAARIDADVDTSALIAFLDASGTYHAVFRWRPGAPYGAATLADESAAAAALAGFLRELRAIDPRGGPSAGRAPLAELDAETRAAIEPARTSIDADAAQAAWRRALGAPAWDGAASWIHGDLVRPNLLVVDGRLDAVIDFGAVGVGDPAMDLVAAWSVFGRAGRAAFRRALRGVPGLDDGTWARTRGHHPATLR